MVCGLPSTEDGHVLFCLDFMCGHTTLSSPVPMIERIAHRFEQRLLLLLAAMESTPPANKPNQ